MDKQEILKAAAYAYYISPEMVRFLLIENLALKTLLHDKGLIKLDEYKSYQDKAATILSLKEQDQMLEHFQKLLNRTTAEPSSQDSSAAEVREE